MTRSIQRKIHRNGLKDNKVNVLEWPSQSPDINPMENLWLDSKRAVHARSPRNLTELEQFCKDEWSKIAVSRCANLIETYPHRLSAVIAAKCASTKYLCNLILHYRLVFN